MTQRSKDAAWTYDDPPPATRPWPATSASTRDGWNRALLDGEAVQAQPGSFYGGWITTSVVGPFKGLAGTLDW